MQRSIFVDFNEEGNSDISNVEYFAVRHQPFYNLDHISNTYVKVLFTI